MLKNHYTTKTIFLILWTINLCATDHTPHQNDPEKKTNFSWLAVPAKLISKAYNFLFGDEKSPVPPTEETSESSDKPDTPPSDHIPSPSDDGEPGFKNEKVSFNYVILGSHAVLDWLNSIHIKSFFEASQSVYNHDECFVFLDPSDRLSIWIEPYGFYSHYRSSLKSKEKMDFKLFSWGPSIGARYLISNEINIGGGIGYFHSHIKHTKEENKAKVDGFYFGPSMRYKSSKGSIGITLFAIKNFHSNSKMKIALSENENKTVKYHSQSWDMNVRLDTDYHLNLPSQFFIKNLNIYPYLRLDYLNVMERGYDSKIAGNNPLSIAKRRSSFFHSKLGAKFQKVLLCHQKGVVSSSMNLGWINMTPLSNPKLKWEYLKNKGEADVKPRKKNQLDLELGLIGMRANGLLIGLEYGTTIGAKALTQTGRVKIEWNW